MIGKAKAISHGINALRYIKGESRNKKEPEKIHPVCDQYLSPDLDAMASGLKCHSRQTAIQASKTL